MVKHLLFFAILLSSHLVQAQIQITSVDVSNIFAPGTSWISSSHEDPQISMNIGFAGGSSQNWSVPPITWQETRTMFNVAPANTPYASTFPTATHSQYTSGIIMGFPATYYQYYQLESNTLISLGNVIRVQTGTIDTAIVTFEGNSIFPLPLTYGTSLEISRDSSDLGGGLWSVLISTLSVDAFGSMSFPFGTYDVLRLNNSDETRIYLNGNLINQYASTYFIWISKDGGIFEGDIDTSTVTSGTVPLFFASMTQYNAATSVDEEQNIPIPTDYVLNQNYPNPFNPSTKISYYLPTGQYVNLKVYDVLGNEVTTLVDGQRNAGTHEIIFNAENLTSGIYFYTLRADNTIVTRKMILMK